MKAIILAAGQGIRLRSMVRNPKCLFKINGETILERQVRLLRKYGVNDITIVLGYKSHLVKKFVDERQLDLHYIDNDKWAQSDNLYSLFLAIQRIEEGFVLLNADVVFDERMLRKLLKCSGHDIYVVGKQEFRIGKFTNRGRTILFAVLNAIQNWELAKIRFLLRFLNVHYVVARYFCDDIDYPDDIKKMRDKIED